MITPQGKSFFDSAALLLSKGGDRWIMMKKNKIIPKILPGIS